MKKTVQYILFILVFSVAIGTRITVMNSYFFTAIPIIVFFGIIHVVIHYKSLDYLALTGKRNSIKIVLSHLFFLCFFLFQVDGYQFLDDYVVFEYITGSPSTTLSKGRAVAIAGFSFMGYIIITAIIVVGVKKEKIKTKVSSIKYTVPILIILFFFTSFMKNSDFYKNLKLHTEEIMRETALETDVDFYSIKRALKNPEKVETLRIFRRTEKISKFPDEIFSFPNIRLIVINGQEISSIPDQIIKLKKLEFLNLIDNNISEIPSSICKCQKLRELFIGGNISSFPDCLKTMKSLKHLSIQSNNVNYLMEALRDFENLETAKFYSKDSMFDEEKWLKIRNETGIKQKY
jgi:hypothetical protein